MNYKPQTKKILNQSDKQSFNNVVKTILDNRNKFLNNVQQNEINTNTNSNNVSQNQVKEDYENVNFGRSIPRSETVPYENNINERQYYIKEGYDNNNKNDVFVIPKRTIYIILYLISFFVLYCFLIKLFQTQRKINKILKTLKDK